MTSSKLQHLDGTQLLADGRPSSRTSSSQTASCTISTSQTGHSPPSPPPVSGCFTCFACSLAGKLDTELATVRRRIFLHTEEKIEERKRSESEGSEAGSQEECYSSREGGLSDYLPDDVFSPVSARQSPSIVVEFVDDLKLLHVSGRRLSSEVEGGVMVVSSDGIRQTGEEGNELGDEKILVTMSNNINESNVDDMDDQIKQLENDFDISSSDTCFKENENDSSCSCTLSSKKDLFMFKDNKSDKISVTEVEKTEPVALEDNCKSGQDISGDDKLYQDVSRRGEQTRHSVTLETDTVEKEIADLVVKHPETSFCNKTESHYEIDYENSGNPVVLIAHELTTAVLANVTEELNPTASKAMNTHGCKNSKDGSDDSRLLNEDNYKGDTEDLTSGLPETSDDFESELLSSGRVFSENVTCPNMGTLTFGVDEKCREWVNSNSTCGELFNCDEVVNNGLVNFNSTGL